MEFTLIVERAPSIVNEVMEPGFGRLKRGPRQGTSISEFLSRFSDSSACLDHVFERNHPNPGPCPKCGRTVRWFRIRSTNRYSSNCCGGSAIHPLPGTVFGNSNLPLGMWFYAILHFCNTSTGLTTENLAIHLGISHKAAYRMGVRIRMHLAALDRERKLGGPGARVYLQEDELVNIRSDDTGRCGRLRVVALSDSADFAVIPIRKGKFHNSLASIRRCLHPESLLEFREEETMRKMTHHRRSKWVESGAWRVTDNPYKQPYGAASSMLGALKTFILRNHIWASCGQIDNYIAHFAFLFRRRHRGETVFWDAISRFPSLEQNPVGQQR